MHKIRESDKYYGFFKAKHVTTYLEHYCKTQTFDGRSLESRIRFSSPVQKLTKSNGLWTVLTKSQNSTLTLQTPHIIAATGLTSQPNYPSLPNWQNFHGRILHHKDFAAFERTHLPSLPQPSRIAVLGGAKSAADVAYACAKNGHHVTWIIRRSGSGPAAFVSAKGTWPYSNSNESFYTRLVSLFLVSWFSVQAGTNKYLLKLLNQTSPGRALLRRIWSGINAKAWKEADYDREDGKANGYYNLKPDREIFWQNDSTGINQREDFFDVIARRVKVVREDLVRMEEDGIVLEHSSVKADVVICATGWEEGVEYLGEEMAARLGVCGPPPEEEEDADWPTLLSHADEKVLSVFPLLRPESSPSPSTPSTPPNFRLYASLLPPSDPSILFPGRLMLGNHFRNSEVQALYCTSMLSSHLPLPPKSEMNQRIAETLAWDRRRYLRKGEKGNWFYWDLVPYTEGLLKEMGLRSHRVGKGMGRTAWAKDLGGLVGEYREKYCGDEKR